MPDVIPNDEDMGSAAPRAGLDKALRDYPDDVALAMKAAATLRERLAAPAASVPRAGSAQAGDA